MVEPRHPAVTAGAREEIEKPGDEFLACRDFSWLAHESAQRFRNPIWIDIAFSKSQTAGSKDILLY